MSHSRFCRDASALAATLVLLSGTQARATSQNWDGGSSVFWTNNVNWSSDSTYPSAGDTATFNAVPSSNRTNINIAGLSRIKYITFDTYNVAAYTIGSNVVNGQTLVMENDANYKINGNAGNSQNFNASIMLGLDRNGGAYYFQNDNTAYTLTFLGDILTPTNGSTIAGKSININGVGNTRILGNVITNGSVGLTLTDNSSGTLTLTGSNTINRLNINGAPSSVIDIGKGYLYIDSVGGNGINASQSGVINGTGKLRLSTASGHNYADSYVAAGKTLIINPEITGATGFEMWSGTGTFVFNGINTFESNVIFGTSGTISVSKIGNKGSTTSNLGQGTLLRFATSGARLLYTGVGETSDRLIQMENSMTLDHSGTGDLIFSSAFNVLANTKTLTLQGSTAGIGEISGIVSNGTATTSLTKDGTGLWRLSAANSFAGGTTVRDGTLALTGANGATTNSSGYTLNGGTLLLDNTPAANNTNRLKDASGVTMNGGTLRFANSGGAVNYSEIVGALSIAQNNNTVSADRAAVGQTSTLTFASLARTAGATVNFSGVGLGVDGRNKIVFTTAPTLVNGIIGPWATVNGTNLATYSASLGVYASPEPAYTDIAARGPSSTIVSNDASFVRINTDGTSGPIQLGSSVTRVASLTQNTATDATVDTAGKSLQTMGVSVPAGKASVTLGSAAGDGSLAALVGNGDLALNSDAAGGGLTVNAVIANSGSASTLTKMGSGTVTLAGANTFSGLTTIGGGTLVLKNSDALQNSTLSSGGTVFDSTVAGDAFTVGGLSGSFPLTLTDNAGTPAPVSLSVGKNNATVTHTGTLSGLGSLTKIGTATQTLSGSNTFSGGLTISQGALTASALASLGTAPVVNNATLNLTGGGVNYTGLSSGLSGTGTVNVTLSTGASSTYLQGDYSGFTGIWNIGIGAAANAGKAYMTGADNSAATINVLSNASLYCNNAGPHYAKLVLKGGNTGEQYGQLRLESNCNWAGPITLAGNITSGEDGFVGSASGTGYITGDISDLDSIPRPFYKIGVGTIALTGNNTFKGQTWIRNGTLRISSITNVGAAGSALGAPQTVANGTIKFGENNTNTVLTYFGMGDTTDRIIEMGGTTGGVTLDQSGTNALIYTGGMIVSGVGSKTLTLQGSTIGTGEFTGVISNGPGSAIALMKAGSGTWTLSNANTYTNGTQIKDGGTLVAAHPNALGTGIVLFPNSLQGTLDLANDGVGETTNEINMQSGAVGTIRSNRSTPGEGINHNLGMWRLSGVTAIVTNGANVVSGKSSITAAYLDLYAGGVATTTLFPTTADLFIEGGVSIISLTGNFAKTLQLDGPGQGSVIRGPISNGLNTVSLTKANTGTWTLTGSNTYSGATAVNNGKLVVSGTDGALLGAGGITVNQGATLRLENNAVTNNGNRLSDTAAITMKGGVLDVAHSGGAASYSETAGQLVVNSGSNTLLTARADESQTASMTFASLSRTGGTINFVGEGLGNSDNRNRVLFTAEPALTNGLIGPWAVINGIDLAAYDSARGVTTFSSYSDLAAKGPDSVITNDATLNARINLPGVDGPITLETSPVSQVYTLLQNTEIPATVTTTSTVFQTSAILIGEGKANLTIGTAQGEGTLSALGGELLLANHDATSLLTVNAPISNNALTVSLSKSGVGTVVLAGSNTYSGTTAINAGTLAFGGSGTQTVTSVISGPGKLAKTGTGRVTLAGANTYLGETSINEGIVVVKNNAAFGSAAAGTVIADGATLDLGGGLAGNAVNLGTEVFTVSGSGVNGLGSIVNELNVGQISAFGRVVLAGDTTVSANGRWDIRQNTPTLTMNGHTLTKIGTNEFCLVDARVIPDGGHLVVTQGLLRLEASVRLNGDASDTFLVKSGAKLDFWNFSSATNASPWTLICDPLASVTAGSSYHPYNTWWGPVTLNGTTFLDGGNTGYSMTFTNAISGDGSLVKNGVCAAFLFSSNNTYAGTTAVSNGIVYVTYPGGLPGYDAANRVIIGPLGTLVTYYGEDGTGWTKEHIDAIRTNANFAYVTACLGIDTSRGNLFYDRDIPQAMSFAKYGTNALTLPGKNLFGGPLKVYGGAVNLPATSTNVIGTVVVNGGTLGAALNIDGFTTLGTNNMNVGSGGNDRSVVTFSTNAVMAKLLVGTTKGGSGAVIQNGGDLRVGTYISGTDVTSLGTGGGYGYYRLNKGSLATGQLGITGGGAGNNDGVFEIYDGSVNMCTNSGWLIWGWAGGNGVMNLFGGSISSPINGNDITFCYGANLNTFAMLNLLGPAAFVDSTGQNTGKAINMARNAGNIAGVLNLNAGTLLVNKVYAGVTGSPSLFNFNGGKMKVNATTTFATTFMQGLTAATVYPGGAVIDTTNVNVTLNQPLLAPVGYGVTTIPLRSQGLGYIGAPTVVISGGSGTGATAIATVDLNEASPTFRQVTGITVTSPGSGYQYGDALSVALRGGGFTNNAAALAEGATLGLNTSGGLTKLGTGTLTLGGTNTFSGSTVISNGTVKLGNAKALLTGTEVILAGGTLDLNGFTVTNQLNVISGTVSNGTLYTDISPAGTNVVGTETITVNGANLKGRYLADVTVDGASDFLTIQGNINLSGLALEIIDTERLNRTQVYTIAQFTGTRTGTFAPDNLPDDRWHILYRPDGSAKLIFVEGTIMMLK